MSKKNKGRKKAKAKEEELEPVIADDTRHGIIAISLFALATFFVLARVNYAGKVGELSYSIFGKLFGVGFLLIPATFIILGLSFWQSQRPNFVLGRVASGLILFLASLGLMDVISDNAGGLMGHYITLPLLNLFQVYMTVIILVVLVIITMLIILDITPQAIVANLKKPKVARDENLDETEEEVVVEEVEEDTEEEETEETPEPPQKQPKTPEVVNDESLFGKLIGNRKSSGAFVPPPLSLLEKDTGKPGTGDIKANTNKIKRTLQNFGVTVEMDDVSVGPSVTRYSLKPAEGIKLAKIVALQNDLSLALAAHPIRIEAPIPGKSLVGIEIPNSVKSRVGLATLLGSKEFTSSPHPLLASLGRGISGTAHFTNIAKAPHMLIAGTTGSGKSVTINAIITSLLYRNAPDQLRFIMVDPKRVELTPYNRIPHLLTPVITDAKKAILALKWAAKEMERRYDLLEKEGVRDIQSYHKKIEGADNDEEKDKMPFIVIIIDELADIMSVYPRELEAGIVRLAQMSRAIGIHLIVSTQRPSVEVITGLIKANIPSRIALKVASQIDSRTILDMGGAEKLLGSGDMLSLSSDRPEPTRIQSAFISEEEVRQVVDHVATQYQDEIPVDINLTPEGNPDAMFAGSIGDDDGDDDDLYEDAREAVISAGKASASYLQRKLKVGYARAARLLDMLEERGVIGPGNGAKAREIYAAPPTPEDETDETTF